MREVDFAEQKTEGEKEISRSLLTPTKQHSTAPLTRVTPRGAGRCRVSDRGDGRRQRLSSDSETEGETYK